MEGTRLKIIQILQRKGQANVAELALDLGLAPATTRRHLDILQRDNLVGFVQVKKKTGRPKYSFSLTEAGQESLPKDYPKLLTSLIKEISSLTPQDTSKKSGDQVLDLLFKRMASQTARQHREQWEGQSASTRLSTLLRILEEEEFLPQAEGNSDGVRIQLLNCPFRSVALGHKAVCGFDGHLISTLLGVPAIQEECINNGDSYCVYHARVEQPALPLSSP